VDVITLFPAYLEILDIVVAEVYHQEFIGDFWACLSLCICIYKVYNVRNANLQQQVITIPGSGLPLAMAFTCFQGMDSPEPITVLTMVAALVI
jgi:hypothetical protein